MTARKAFLWAAFGSLLPEVLRLYRLTVDANPLPSYNWWQYAILSLLFVTFAGFFSVAWQPETELKAVWLGASFPIVVAQLIASTPTPHLR